MTRRRRRQALRSGCAAAYCSRRRRVWRPSSSSPRSCCGTSCGSWCSAPIAPWRGRAKCCRCCPDSPANTCAARSWHGPWPSVIPPRSSASACSSRRQAPALVRTSTSARAATSGWPTWSATPCWPRASTLPAGRGRHRFDDLSRPIREQPGTLTLVRIGAGAWVGSAAVVMADVGRNAVVGAGAVVTKPMPDGVVAAGVPARVLRARRTTGDGLFTS